ncbi:hypothetical protein EJO68_11550 [Variovorax atrisoli]|uniref:hypothetical protein n=1 Tax=Variovorax atrisoli TaxID=3394203 RepID=UPI000F7ED17A|nr:hypothetical protein [Variovorax sp. 369]RTD94411.1 hypothetical protein EJO68_11550 [Variovorax sp. 369]
MEELLRRIVEQNDALIGLNNRKLAALQDVVDKLDAVYSQLILNDVSSEVTTASMHLQQAVSAIETVADKLDELGEKIDDVGDKLED